MTKFANILQTVGNTPGPGQGPGVGSAGQFAVNGLRSRANNFTVDGSDNNEGEDDSDDEPVAGPIAIALDMNEPEAATADVAVTPAVPSP